MIDTQKIYDNITGINNIFGIEKQGRKLVSLISRVLRCPYICLLFLDETGETFTVLACKPALKNNHLAAITIGVKNSALEHMVSDKKVITREDAVFHHVLRTVCDYSGSEKKIEDIELLVPIISNEHLIGLIIIENRSSGKYTTKEISILNDIVLRLASGMEKEYLRHRLVQREKELVVLKNCSVIISSSLDTSSVFENFTGELKKMLDIDWSAITLIDGDSMSVIASYSDTGTSWWMGERMPVKGTATEWVTASRVPLVESDLKNDSLFVTDVYYRKHGIRSIICLPLLVNGEEPIGSFIVGSSQPNSYNPQQVEFLREVTSLVYMPVKNARLYAEVLKKSRYDELTGLLNRRSMDEQIISEVNRHSRYGGVFSLIILDLDSMKIINDTFGHLAGDGVLSRTGNIIKESIRNVDQAFRYGGDEFAVLLPNTPADAAVKVSERVRKRIATKLVVDDMTVTASFGLASWPENGIEANDVVAAADAALYKAKNLGGNQSKHNSEVK